MKQNFSDERLFRERPQNYLLKLSILLEHVFFVTTLKASDIFLHASVIFHSYVADSVITCCQAVDGPGQNSK